MQANHRPSSKSHALFVAALSLKDVYYLVGTALKRMQRFATGTFTKTDALACNKIAWRCVRQAMSSVVVANTGQTECLNAFVCRSVHNEFEDNLVLATARSLKVDDLVTGDEHLALHSPVGALSPMDTANLLEAERPSR